MPDTNEIEATRLLAIYLHDHRAGAAAGLRLVERSREHAAGDLSAMLTWLAAQIAEDRDSLDAIMAGLAVQKSPLKSAVAVVAERVGRLKLNGHLWKRSPLTDLIELEALAAAVFTKRNLWQTLSAIAERSPHYDAGLLTRLIDRATDQLARIEEQHALAARAVFDPAASTPATAVPASSDHDEDSGPRVAGTAGEPVTGGDPLNDTEERFRTGESPA